MLWEARLPPPQGVRCSGQEVGGQCQQWLPKWSLLVGAVVGGPDLRLTGSPLGRAVRVKAKGDKATPIPVSGGAFTCPARYFCAKYPDFSPGFTLP